jgi:SAM-dependent methyltransferase
MTTDKVNFTINAYEKFHDVYDEETKEFWDNFPRSVLDKYATSLSGKRILNIGSGPGRDALLLKERGLEVICLDASYKMVEITKKLGFESLVCDFRKIPKNIGKFDGVWAYTSLLHVTRSEMLKVLDRIYELLFTDGVFLMGMIEGIYQGLVDRDSMPGVKRYFIFYKEKELVKIVESAGFKFAYQKKYKPHNNIYLNQIYLK